MCLPVPYQKSTSRIRYPKLTGGLVIIIFVLLAAAAYLNKVLYQ